MRFIVGASAVAVFLYGSSLLTRDRANPSWLADTRVVPSDAANGAGRSAGRSSSSRLSNATMPIAAMATYSARLAI